ncbi:MAG: type II secretion system protein [Anaplasmataceae bacterium]|nr:type II secretion system protein [Anaplasmataceae bacterium]
MYHQERRSGFTLVESLVAVGIFATVISLAAGGFVQALRTQRQLEGVISANSNASLAIEQMSREIRTGRAFCDNDDIPLDSNQTNPFLGASMICDPYDSDEIATSTTFINFKNSSGTFVQYSHLIDSETGYGYIAREEQIGNTAAFTTPARLTAKNVNVEYLFFTGSGWGADARHHARVTILVGISALERGVEEGVTRFQTTVSSRGGGNIDPIP